MSSSRFRLALLALALASPAAASAGSSPQSSSFQVNAQVNASCQIVSTGDIDFGVYDPLSTTANDATGSVTVRCSQGTTDVLVALDQGANPATGSTAAAPLPSRAEFEAADNKRREHGYERFQARAAERYRKLTEKIRIAEARLLFARWRDAAATMSTATVRSLRFSCCDCRTSSSNA